MSEHRSLFLSWWVGKRPHPNWVMLKLSQYFKSFALGNFLFPFLHLNNNCHSFFLFFSFFRLLFFRINLGFWETANLALSLANINTYFSLKEK